MPLFSGTDLVLYFFFYGFFAWITATIFVSLKEQCYRNFGILNLPILVQPALIMIFLIFLSSGKRVSTPGLLFMTFLYGIFTNNISLFFLHKFYQNKNSREIFPKGNLKISAAYSILLTIPGYVLLKSFHPLLFSVVSLLPLSLVHLLAALLLLSLVSDIVLLYLLPRKYYIKREEILAHNRKLRLGEWISRGIWNRIYRQYPSLLAENEENSVENGASPSAGIAASDQFLQQQGIIFAEGIHFYKLIWMLLITSFMGDIIETVYVFLTAHVLMRRSSLVLGPFSIVWGLGAVILTLVLSKVKKQNNLSIFIAGFFFGGAFEYLCSVFTEVFFGMKFWDYSHMPFNIDGRTNLLFMIFWGIVSVLWFHYAYPPISRFIEKIPPILGSVLAIAIAIFFLSDSMVTAMVMVRATDRKEHPEPRNAIESFIDQEYPENVVRALWPNMNFLGE